MSDYRMLDEFSFALKAGHESSEDELLIEHEIVRTCDFIEKNSGDIVGSFSRHYCIKLKLYAIMDLTRSAANSIVKCQVKQS